MAGACESYNVPSGTTKCGVFLDCLRTCQLLSKQSISEVSCVSLHCFEVSILKVTQLDVISEDHFFKFQIIFSFFIFVIPCIVILCLKNPTRFKSMQIFIYC